jgi:uncharacterized protein (TIGR02246 family)
MFIAHLYPKTVAHFSGCALFLSRASLSENRCTLFGMRFFCCHFLAAKDAMLPSVSIKYDHHQRRYMMRFKTFTTIFASLCLMGATTAFAAETTSKDHDDILATVHSMTSAFEAHNMKGILAQYEPSAVLVAQPGQPLQGTPALTAAFNQFIAVNPKFTFINEEIIQADDIAMHINVWKMTGKLPDGTPVQQGGLSVVVLRKQADGKWLMVIDNPYADRLLHP